MLIINTKKLPRTCLSYLAFRISFRETLERLVLARQMGEIYPEGFGFLNEVPFLRGIPPHVQLDLLAETWRRHLSADLHLANLMDESIIYAVAENAANLVVSDPNDVRQFLHNGPLDVQIEIDFQLSTEIRGLQAALSDQGEFLLISQFEDMDPEAARQLKDDFGILESRERVLFDALARWKISPNFIRNLSGLISKSEEPHLEPVFPKQWGA